MPQRDLPALRQGKGSANVGDVSRDGLGSSFYFFSPDPKPYTLQSTQHRMHPKNGEFERSIACSVLLS